jgi:hypothetical protein
METSKTSNGETLFDLTCYAVDTPANHSAPQANAKAQKTRDICGLGLERPLANYDPGTQSWKMYGDTYLWGESPLLENLPISGMTRNGELFLQPAWEPITAETVLLSWPTPTTQDHIERKSTQQKPGSMHSVGLGDAVRMWATPTARDGKGAANYRKQSRNEADLTNQARAEDGVGSGSLNPRWVEWLMGFPIGWTDLED